MEIIHIILGKANPDRLNGVNKVIYNLATKQAENGEKVSVWGITDNLEKNFLERKFETQLFKKTKNPFAIPSSLKEEILKQDGETIFHLHGGWIPVYFSLSRFFKKNNHRFVITAHGAYNTVAMEKNYFIKKLYFSFFEKKLLSKAKKIHCIGESEINGIQKIYRNHKSTLIPYGFDMEKKNPIHINSGKEIIFGFLGRLDIYTKGLDVLIDAFAEFNSQIPNSKLWIIGNGKQQSELERIITSKSLESQVLLLGSKFGEEKNILLSQIDVFMHPSRNEGLPISVLEAASFGKPCIVSSFTNIGDKIEKYNVGFEASQFSTSEFVKAMLSMYKIWEDKNHFKILSENAVRMVETEYNWEKILIKLKEELYAVQLFL